MPPAPTPAFESTLTTQPTPMGQSPSAAPAAAAGAGERRVARADESSAGDSSDIGRASGGVERELFVSCDPAPALLQQFDHLQPEFIAVHDIGAHSSRALLAGVAAALRIPVGKLLIRRQGYGTTLAALEFVDFPTTRGVPLRMYCTEAEGDVVSRQGLARVLLAYSRLGVLMVGDLPAPDLAAALMPLRDDIVKGPWPNRELLLLPRAATAALASQASALGRGTGVTVRTTPAVSRPADAWTFITGTWSRLCAQLAASGKMLPALTAAPATADRGADAASAAKASAPPAAVARDAGVAAPTAALIARYVEQLHTLNGMRACCVFEVAGGHAIAHAGDSADPASLAAEGSALQNSIAGSSGRLGFAGGVLDASITLETHHLILRSVPRHPELTLHAVLDKRDANLTLARLQIQRLDELFEQRSS